MTITVIDYGVGNLQSVKKAFEYLGETVVFATHSKDIYRANKIVFPGQGACGHALSYLRQNELVNPLLECIDNGIPFLGICLGFQLLFRFSQEDGGQNTLGLLSGSVNYFQGAGLKVPQIGWNSLTLSNKNDKSLAGIQTGDCVYFVHSLYATDVNPNVVTATATYGATNFVASICQNNLWGMQFHPEKSGEVGITILENFSRL